MKLTKFEHACFTLQSGPTTILVDPGTYSHDLIIPKRVDAVVVTHDHPDHCDPANIQKIIDQNEAIRIIGPEAVVGRFPAAADNFVAMPGATTTVGPISLRFFGGQHAPIAEGVQVPANVGVLFDNRLYYPGDSFALPNISIRELAVPVSAPWLKIAETFGFLKAIRPEMAFPTHDGILSADGKQLVDAMVGGVARAQGTMYRRLDGGSIDLT